MITGLNHSGLVVEDLERSLHFYRDVIGLEVVRTMERDGGPISDVVGYENTHLKGAMLSLNDGHVIELIQYVRPEVAERPTQERAVLGGSHIAFNVDDIQKTMDALISNGAKQLNPPVETAPGRKVCYMQDPDGNWIELLEINE